ncbi:hypothetical protein MOX02_59310 [Methylobacterium oxalidis]|uniref:Uncharacterized protein n=1 Tax=Methylobacterium oxalidis TaxID=944322 RepID=A0A512JD57_9HYPH|nr:hypothetical protein MOX02_59310 [Methylobacterium oxalidis]
MSDRTLMLQHYKSFTVLLVLSIIAKGDMGQPAMHNCSLVSCRHCPERAHHEMARGTERDWADLSITELFPA